jgi:hypothetical protein
LVECEVRTAPEAYSFRELCQGVGMRYQTGRRSTGEDYSAFYVFKHSMDYLQLSGVG